jgi:hypothetical protein
MADEGPIAKEALEMIIARIKDAVSNNPKNADIE